MPPSKQFGRAYDGRRGAIVCSKCFEDKKQDEVEQVRDGRALKYVCHQCMEEEE